MLYRKCFRRYEKTHLILAGGSAFGLRHGQHVRYREGSKPFANLFLTMVRQAGLRAESFAGSNGVLSELT